jgi:chemotaxis protein methyltransferase CheR
MMMKEHFPELAGWRTAIVATDLNEQVLAKARAGRYTQFEVNRGLPAPLMSRWFSRAGAEWQLDREILNAVQLRPLNLIGTARYPQADLILLRNVLIYFDTETKRQILSRVREALRPGGYLLLGASESPLLLQSGFERADIGRGGCFRAV